MKILITLLIIFIIFEIPISFGMGLIFKKKNLDFKKGIIPFYNKIILIKKYNLPQYHLILTFIPIIGLYTNFIIYKKIVNNKDLIYILELTLMPFIFNIFLGIELKNEKEEIENYFEDQKDFYSKEDQHEQPKEQEDEYIWYAKQKIKSDTIYKASKNKMNAKINLNTQNNNTIIYKKTIEQPTKNKIVCPNCGAQLPDNTEICFACGTKI